MRYSLHETDKHRVVATTAAADRDEALEWFSEKLRLMLPSRVTLWPPIMYLTNGLRACWHTLKSRPFGVHSERTSYPPPGITRSWMWSDRCLSGDRLSSIGYPPVQEALC